MPSTSLSRLTLASLAALLALAACGGGGDDGDSNPGTAGGAAAAAARYEAPFAASAPMRYVVFGETTTSMGGRNELKPTQETGGGLRSLTSYKVSSDTKVEDIAGNAAYAKGTWLGGSLIEVDDKGLESSVTLAAPCTTPSPTSPPPWPTTAPSSAARCWTPPAPATPRPT